MGSFSTNTTDHTIPTVPDRAARASGIVHGAGVGRVGGRENRIRLRRSPTPPQDAVAIAANPTTSVNSTSDGDDVNMTYGGNVTALSDDGMPACYDAAVMTFSMDFDNPPSGTVNGGT
jgi:hypothetical protein